MSRRVPIKVTAILLLQMVLVFAFGFRQAMAFETKLRVEAPPIVTGGVGSTFEVSIIAENVLEPGFAGWELILSWTPSVINCTTETINTNIWPFYLGPWVANPIDNINGNYWQSLTYRAPSEPAIGTYWLVNLTFSVVQSLSVPWETDLTILLPGGYDAYILLDEDANEIPHDFVNGHVQILPSSVIPEVPLGTVMTSAALIVALVAYAIPNWKKRRRNINP